MGKGDEASQTLDKGSEDALTETQNEAG
jgi:hypothetical protein